MNRDSNWWDDGGKRSSLFMKPVGLTLPGYFRTPAAQTFCPLLVMIKNFSPKKKSVREDINRKKNVFWGSTHARIFWPLFLPSISP